ncbi:MAG: protoheme IX farnesyltransferase [Acidobacteria bacterium]|nr:MAG: protoheme IX farnesyltransferase [Acidobacteriota bacterium]
MGDYWTLTKPEVNFLVVVSTLVGFYLGSHGRLDWLLLVHTLLGTLLVASGTATLNQFMEREADSRMRRTAMRPLPAGRLSPSKAFWFGMMLSAAGAIYLWRLVNGLASALAVFTLATYLLVYTPLKRKTPFCTLVGAFPGAVPPLIGWAAARGGLNGDRSTTLRILVYSSALLPVSLAPVMMGQVGLIYFFGAIILGLGLLGCGGRLAVTRSKALARRVVLASVVYLPLVFALMMFDKIAT